MKYVLFVLLALFVAACTQQEPTPPSQPTGGNQQPAQPTTPQPTDVQEPEPTDPRDVVAIEPEDRLVFTTLPNDVNEVISRAPQKSDDGVSYVYTELQGRDVVIANRVHSNVYEKDGVRKVIIRDNLFPMREERYHVVIVQEDGTARAYCTSDRTCVDGESLPAERRGAQLAEYNFHGPLQWLELMTNPKYTGEATLERRKTMRLEADVDDSLTILNVDRYSGLPVRVEHKGITYVFGDLALGVSDAQMEIMTP